MNRADPHTAPPADAPPSDAIEALAAWLREAAAGAAERPAPALSPGAPAARLAEAAAALVERARGAEGRADELAERLDLLARGADDGLWDWNLETGEVYYSPRWKQILGYAEDEIAAEFAEWRSRVHPDDLEHALAAVRDYLEGRSPAFELEHRLRHKSGEYRWISTRGAARRDADGRAVRFAGAHWDITERRRAEAQLREAEAQYRAVFETTSDGLLITDPRTGLIVEANPAVCLMHGRSREQLVGLPLTAIIASDSQGHLGEAMREVRAGRPYRTRTEDVRLDGSRFPVEVTSSMLTFGGRPHYLGVVRDITDQVQAYRLLEQRVEERTRELSTLLEVAGDMTSTLDLATILSLILDRLRAVVDHTGSSVVVLEGDALVIRDTRTFLPGIDVSPSIGLRFSLAQAGPVWAQLSRREPVLIDDVYDESEHARAYRAAVGPLMGTALAGVRSWMAAPLALRDRVIGFITLSRDHPHAFSERQAQLASAVAAHAAVAVENARLYAHELQTADELSTLLEISRAISSTLEIEPLLGVVLDQLKGVVEYASASIVTDDGGETRTREYRGPLPREQVLARPAPSAATLEAEAALRRGEATIIADVWGDEPAARRYRAQMGEEYLRTTASYLRCLLAVPLMLKGELIGAVVLTHSTPGYYGERHAALVGAFANQAAVALENARLYGEAQKLAALEERQRLARELHDSVSQVLFSIGLTARTARTLLDRAPERAAGPLDQVLNLAEMGMAEMKALIFELRPESLASEGIVPALVKQAAALRARHALAIDTQLCTEPDVPLAVKEALYRIAQEALHNTVKHARAGRVTVRLTCDASGIDLEVADDGAGFDPGGDFPGHLGLRSMRERAQRLGGTLHIESAPGAGTAVRVHIPTDE